MELLDSIAHSLGALVSDIGRPSDYRLDVASCALGFFSLYPWL